MPNFKQWFQRRPESKLFTETSRPASITFAVDDVKPLDGEFWLTNLQDSLTLRAGEVILAMPERDRPALAAEGYFRPKQMPPAVPLKDHTGPIQPFRTMRRSSIPEALANPGSIPTRFKRDYMHPLVQAVELAFGEHHPLKLSPDSIWMAIVQGFGHHVRQNAEALRDRIVRHEGKALIEILAPSLAEEAWPQLIAQFSEQIREASDPVLHEALIGNFSTTTAHIRTAYEAAMMDAYQDFFEYQLMCVCGIPTVTVEGTVDDWQRMRDRIEVFATYDLEWWIRKLRPILDQFIATAAGKPDRVFWQAIFKPERPYGASTASGWISDIFPYLRNSNTGWYRNRVLDMERTNWRLPPPPHEMGSFGANLNHFPSGLSRAPITIDFGDGSGREKQEVDLIGGFLGVGQDEDKRTLYPILSWAVVQRPKAPTPEEIQAAKIKRQVAF